MGFKRKSIEFGKGHLLNWDIKSKYFTRKKILGFSWKFGNPLIFNGSPLIFVYGNPLVCNRNPLIVNRNLSILFKDTHRNTKIRTEINTNIEIETHTDSKG